MNDSEGGDSACHGVQQVLYPKRHFCDKGVSARKLSQCSLRIRASHCLKFYFQRKKFSPQLSHSWHQKKDLISGMVAGFFLFSPSGKNFLLFKIYFVVT